MQHLHKKTFLFGWKWKLYFEQGMASVFHSLSCQPIRTGFMYFGHCRKTSTGSSRPWLVKIQVHTHYTYKTNTRKHKSVYAWTQWKTHTHRHTHIHTHANNTHRRTHTDTHCYLYVITQASQRLYSKRRCQGTYWHTSSFFTLLG